MIVITRKTRTRSDYGQPLEMICAIWGKDWVCSLLNKRIAAYPYGPPGGTKMQFLLTFGSLRAVKETEDVRKVRSGCHGYA